MHRFSDWRWPGRLTILILILFLLTGQTAPAFAQAGGIQVTRSEAKPAFPDTVTFLLAASSAAQIERVTLIYGVVTDSCLSSQARQELKIEAGTSVNADWVWDLKRSGNLPPGVKIWWQWEIQAGGERLTTDAQEIVIEDDSFVWKKLSRGKLTLYWSEGSDAFGRQMLEIAAASLDRLGKNAGLSVEKQIELRLYPSAEDMRGALVRITEWAGGVAFPEYNITLIGISPDDDPSWPRSVIPHELAHLVTGMRTFNCLNNELPHWFNEGLSEYAEGQVPESEMTAVLNALKRGMLPDLTSLSDGFPADSGKAELAYNQSRVMVSFILEQYGPEKLEALLDQIRDGVRGSEALRNVYGLDANGLDQTWRAGQGYGSAPEPSFATPSAAAEVTAIPTIALFSPFDTATPTSSPTVEPTPTAAPPAQPSATPAAVSQATAVSAEGAEKGLHENLTVQRPNPFWLMAGGAGVIAAAVALYFILRSMIQRKS